MYFTTGQVASICRVCPKTVAKWFDGGELQGFRTPTPSKCRRIERASLVAFMTRHELPLEWLTEDTTKAEASHA